MSRWQTSPRRGARAAAQQDALVPDHARHHHRRRRRDRDGRDRRRGQGPRRAGVRVDGDEPAHRRAGRDDVGRRARRLRLAADAHLGRPARDPRPRSPTVRCAAPQLRATAQIVSRGAATGRRRHRHHARVLRHPQLAGAPAARCFTAQRRRAGAKMVVLGRPSPSNLFGAEHRSHRADGAHQERPVPGGRRAAREGAVADGAGLRRRRVRAGDDVPGQDPGRAAEVHRGHDLRSSASDGDGTARGAERSRPRCCAIATASPTGGDDDFSIRNLTEIASRAAGEHARR